MSQHNIINYLIHELAIVEVIETYSQNGKTVSAHDIGIISICFS